MANEHHLSFPLKESEIRKLETGDIVYVNGTIHTMRDMGYRRAVTLLEQGCEKELPFNLRDGMVWHCGPIVKFNEDTKKWEMPAAGSTTSSRFTALGAKLIEYLDIRVTLGKGTMYTEAQEAIKRVGSCYLSTTGGCAALYAQFIEEVEAVHWEDLGLPEAIWVIRVKNFGPLTVGIDACGNSLYDSMKKNLQDNLREIYVEHDLKDKYAFLPKRVFSCGS